ncbi:nucleotidyltransferase family protein [Mucilaginibacter robiniae]|uniref:Nucleotidyltransferase family protein n=1 Tax=Mucilaginibacter robiniae TaxID=2728022 RepID=A0A7L5E3Q0_9SPHI|nr:nucleotidyltransferase family protein [Mucilaginibacter robiniae]QJD97238.1 nucleotidyltransferase family protein [Mucilaginibacter robiniae]
MSTTGIIILAAGASSRMGQPKQKLVYQQQTLLQRAVAAALASNGLPVIVVLGANYEAVQPDIAEQPVQIIHNADWEQGMASSIQSGLRYLQEKCNQIDSILLMLCDQPFVDSALLNQLINQQMVNEASIVACAYQNTLGAPVLFSKAYFPELLALQWQEGAKKLLMKYRDQVKAFPFPKGSVDVDTPDDYQDLLQD